MRKLFRFLKKRVFKVREGEVMPPLLVFIRIVMFPREGLWYLVNKGGPVRYDYFSDCLIFQGKRFTREFLEDCDSV